MRRILLLLPLFMLSTLGAAAQILEKEKLKQVLDKHTRQDTFRVNRLNKLAANTSQTSEEREKFANEAFAISRKINYLAGQGNALMFLGSVKFNEGKPKESESFFRQADSIAQKTGNLELRANVLWRMTDLKSTVKEKELLFSEADSIAQRTGDLKLRMDLLVRWTNIKSTMEEKELLFKKADSLGKQSGNLEFQVNVLYWMASLKSTVEERDLLYRQADSIAKKTDDLELQARVLYWVGYNLANSDGKRAISYILETEEIAGKSGSMILLSDYQRSIGAFYDAIFSDYAKAMEYYLKALHSAEEANDLKSIASVWAALGGLYTLIGDHANALIYFQKAKAANKKLGDKFLEGRLHNHIGESYRLTGNYQEAIQAYNNALALTKDPTTIEVYESNLADVYTRMDSLQLAFQYGFSSHKRVYEMEDVVGIGWTNGILSRAYLKKKMPDSAIHYAILGLDAAKQTGTIEYMRDNTEALANAYAFKKDFEKAYYYHLQYVNYRDSMLSAEVRNKTAVQQYSFNLENKETQINALHQQKKAQKNLLIGTVILLLLIITTAFLLLRNIRQKQKANKLLKKQKQEIDGKAKELAVQKGNLEQSYRNIELLGQIGRKITSSLSVEKIISTAYNNVNSLMDANVFGIGLYNDILKRIEFPATYEEGKPLPFYANSIDDKNRFAPICFNSGKEIIIGNMEEEYQDYLQHMPAPHEGEQPLSLIFLPLMAKEKKLGVITIQSFQHHAYTDYHLFMLRNIAVYTGIALDNAESYEELNQTITSLKSTQALLIQSEKMASLGELTAGIAHEIQNPLNFVNNFSEVNNELITEMKQEIDEGNFEEVKSIAKNISENEQKIIFHGKRADAIVKGMLQHSRSSSGVKEATNINALTDEYLRLAYHGLRAKDKSFNATMKTDFDMTIEDANVISQDIGRVVLNLITNAFYAVSEKKKQLGENYEPTVTVGTKKLNGNVQIIVRDNGNGIPQHVLDKIFQPFFTTKPTGEGTGLGLSMSYDIITKAHGGELNVKTKDGEFAEFIITLPK